MNNSGADTPNMDLHQIPQESTYRAVKTLLRTARYGALAVIDASTGAPVTSRVGLATDTNGRPIFPASALGQTVKRMEKDSRVSLLIGEIVAGDPLAHPRLSLSGCVTHLSDKDHSRARARYLSKHPGAKLYIDFKDFSIWSMTLQSALFIEGFGQAYRLDGNKIETDFSDWSGWNSMEAGAVAHMNEDHDDAVALYATEFCGAEPGAWQLTGLDPDGLDLALGDDHRRLFFDRPLTETASMRPALIGLVKQARIKQAKARKT